MATKNTKSGLGAKVLFQGIKQTDQVANGNGDSELKTLPKYKASLELAGETYKALASLKLHFRELRGKNVSFAQIIDQAIQELLEKEEIQA